MIARSEVGSAAKPILILSLLIAGTLTMYLYSKDAARLAPEGGVGASFIAHNQILHAEIRALSTEASLQIQIEETADRTVVNVLSDGDTCNELWLNMAYSICAAHRVQSHRDSRCQVEYAYDGGSCRHPR
jgi:hypothetical protein